MIAGAPRAWPVKATRRKAVMLVAARRRAVMLVAQDCMLIVEFVDEARLSMMD